MTSPAQGIVLLPKSSNSYKSKNLLLFVQLNIHSANTTKLGNPIVICAFSPISPRQRSFRFKHVYSTMFYTFVPDFENEKWSYTHILFPMVSG